MFKSATDSLTSFTIVWVPTPIGYSVAIRANVITNILTNIKSLCKTTPPIGRSIKSAGRDGWLAKFKCSLISWLRPLRPANAA